MRRVAILIYGVLCYAMFLGVFVYAVGFMGNFGVPHALDSHPQGPVDTALAVNLLLLSFFALQHSGMARPAFKRWLTKFVPQSMERSTYVLCSNFAMILLFWQWRPMGGTVWDVENNLARMLLYGVYGCGWFTVFISTCLINHFDLFGLRQVWLQFCDRPYSQLPFRTPGPYRLVRHPLYVGWLTVFWATPTMSTAHLFFALITTAYILVAIQLEERDLADALPGYAEYRNRVPMLIPFLAVKPNKSEGVTASQ